METNKDRIIIFCFDRRYGNEADWRDHQSVSDARKTITIVVIICLFGGHGNNANCRNCTEFKDAWKNGYTLLWSV